MKTTYVAPRVEPSGSVICETLGLGMLAPREAGLNYKPMFSASVGFYL